VANSTIFERTAFRRSAYIVMVALILLGEAVGVGVWYLNKTSNKELSNAFGGGALTLFFGALLGGIVSLLIGELHRLRVHRAANIEYITNVLADLKAVYDNVDRGRTLIAAHQSAKTYGDEMRNFIGARVKLLQVERALKFDKRGSTVRPAVESGVKSMEGYLKLLIEEFTKEYKEISLSQSIYEANMASMKKALEHVSPTENNVPELPGNAPWDRIAALGKVRDFLKSVDDCEDPDIPDVEKSGYCTRFLKPLDSVSCKLRKALEAQY
jgi:hypothetical protein